MNSNASVSVQDKRQKEYLGRKGGKARNELAGVREEFRGRKKQKTIQLPCFCRTFQSQQKESVKNFGVGWRSGWLKHIYLKWGITKSSASQRTHEGKVSRLKLTNKRHTKGHTKKRKRENWQCKKFVSALKEGERSKEETPQSWNRVYI